MCMKNEKERIENYYIEFGPMILRRCRSILKDEALAYDAMHDIFVKLLSKPIIIEHSPSYLYRMATNHSLNILKRNSRLSYFYESPESIDSFDLEEKIISSIQLEDIFRKVPESTRIIAELRYVSKFTLDEISEAVGMSISGVRKRLRKLKEICIKEME